VLAREAYKKPQHHCGFLYAIYFLYKYGNVNSNKLKKMKNQTTSEWLSEGAYAQYRATGYETKIAVIGMLICVPLWLLMQKIITSTVFGRLHENTIGCVWLASLYIAFYFFVSLIIRRKKKQVGNMKKWQNAYLQSKIDEFVSYDKNLSSTIEDIKKHAAQKISQLQKNWEEMKNKAEQAKGLLT
jgi:hypothetical protein